MLDLEGRVLTDEESSRLAYHETGHALLGMLQPGADELTKVSIFPSARVSERTRDDSPSHRRLPGESYRRGRIIGLLGGLAAEEIVYGNVTEATAFELEEVRALVTEMIGPHRELEAEGMVSLLPSLGIPAPARSGESGDEIDRVIEECLAWAVTILRENRVRLDMLAHALVEHETLDASEALAAAGISAGGNVSPRTASFRVGDGADEPRLRRRDGNLLRRRTERATRMSQLTQVAPVAEVASITEPGFRHQSVSALSHLQRARYWGLALIWGIVTVTFWVWWLRHAAHSTPVLYWLQTAMLFYQTTVLPTVYWSFVGQMRRPVEIEPPAGVGVALITLCVPAQESLSVIRKQLDALQGVNYPHDSWILDEGGSADVRALAEERGVHYFTRRGIAFWNQAAPPFQAKTKAGNVNAWLDHVASLGLEFEVFVQFDVDHRPRPDYLDRTLGYFRDSEVAWVQAPSVGANNLEEWTARGLTEQDLVFHGPLQMGFYGATRTPFIVGSHTSYRTAAVREIGGFQPTRAEDHLDTVVLAAHGYTGVFVPDLIAVGDGPDTFATYLRQQFAWAYSMIQIFFHHTPRLVRRYTLRQALQFLFCQSWYTLWSISLALLWALPTVALLSGQPIASVKLPTFLVYFLPVLLASSLMWCETRKWFQPGGVRLSWRGILLGVARWPVIVWALINVVLRIKRPYMITPKGVAGAAPRALTLYGPGLAMAGLPLGALWAFHLTGGAAGMRGYYWLALANAIIGLVLVATTATLEMRRISCESGAWRALRVRGGVIVAVVALAALMSISILSVWAPMVKVIA
ncbi:MAG TPA: glycosyltransferase family 2 protein [Solirubrobacteraceae bacterium]|nr:glycosyltransferase family 2 protein [Solirubrobacteraceae bacterium]